MEQKTVIPGMPTVIPPGLTREQERAYIGKYTFCIRIRFQIVTIYSEQHFMCRKPETLKSCSFEMGYGQVYFSRLDVTHQFLLCKFCIWSSLFWSVRDSSVLHECQEGRGTHLGVRVVPSPAPHPALFSCCSLPVGEVSVFCLSGHGPSGEHCRYYKLSTFFTAWPFTISYSSLPFKCGFLLFIGTFWKEKLSLIKELSWKCWTVHPFLSFCWI